MKMSRRGKVISLNAVDAFSADYRLYEIIGQTAILTEALIDRQSIPQGFYAYDFRDPDGGGEICEIRNFIHDGRTGTFILCKPIADADCGIIITEEEMIPLEKEISFGSYANSMLPIEEQIIRETNSETSCPIVSNRKEPYNVNECDKCYPRHG